MKQLNNILCFLLLSVLCIYGNFYYNFTDKVELNAEYDKKMNEEFSALNKKLEKQSSLNTTLSNSDIAKHIRSIQQNETHIASLEIYRNPLYFEILNQKTKEFLAILKTKNIVYTSPEKLTIKEYMDNIDRKFTQKEDELNSYFKDYDKVYTATDKFGGKTMAIAYSIIFFLGSFMIKIYVFSQINKYPLLKSIVVFFTINLSLNIINHFVPL